MMHGLPPRKTADPDAPLEAASYESTRASALGGLAPPFWSDDYSVGHAELDSQHMRLLALCHAAHDACAYVDARGREMLHLLLNELFLYADHHITAEESILAAAGYPDLAAHRERHDSWQERLADLLVSSLDHAPDAAVIRAFLLDWWRHHILEEDMRFRDHLLAAR